MNQQVPYNEEENILLLCPNCHAQTDNYCGKNANSGKIKVSDEELVEAIKNTDSIRQALLFVGLTPKGGNYSRAYNLKEKYKI